MLKDNKIPGTSTGTMAAKAPSRGAGSAAGFLGKREAGLCERPGACFDQGGLNTRNFSKTKRGNRGTQRLFRELSQQLWTLASLSPQPLDCECLISSASTHLSQVGMHPDQWTGCPHLKPWVGMHPDQRPVCKAWDRCPTQSTAWLPLCDHT